MAASLAAMQAVSAVKHAAALTTAPSLAQV